MSDPLEIITAALSDPDHAKCREAGPQAEAFCIEAALLVEGWVFMEDPDTVALNDPLFEPYATQVQ